MHWHIGISLNLCNTAFSEKYQIAKLFVFIMLCACVYTFDTHRKTKWWPHVELGCGQLCEEKWRWNPCVIMTSSNGKFFRVMGPLCGEFIGHRWIPRTKASDTELWCFLWSDGWVSNGEAGDLRRHCDHNVVTYLKMDYQKILSGCTRSSGPLFTIRTDVLQ